MRTVDIVKMIKANIDQCEKDLTNLRTKLQYSYNLLHKIEKGEDVKIREMRGGPMMSKEQRKKIPLGYHKADEKGVRIIKRLEKGSEVTRIETTYYIENYGYFTHYSQAINQVEVN